MQFFKLRYRSLKFIYGYLFFTCCFLLTELHAQEKKGPVAEFLFNEGKEIDEVAGIKAKLVGTKFTEDRFGNSNNAVYVFGNEYSYINLGTNPVMKPRAGTISIWVKMELEVYAGNGGRINPIIITKCADRADFNEAYQISYIVESKRIDAATSKDSLKQISIYSMKSFSRMKWHHLVLSYNDELFSFYVDGKLEGRAPKNFETKFNPLDSVMIGASASKKNARYLNGVVDDVVFYDRVLSDSEIAGLFNAPNPNKYKIIMDWVLRFFALLTGVLGIYFFIRYRLKLGMQKEKQQLELANQLLENELRINRAQMNPHFMFNSLNTLHNYILTHNTDKASDYLLKFSKLVRKVLDSNMSDTITLEMELELIDRYLEIEGMRFNEHIKHSIHINQTIVPSSITIPIMMIQPFIENSVWHGLREKAGDKIISISFSLLGTEYLQCIIEDNGTGRKLKNPDLQKKKSLAIGFVEQRLTLLNKIYHLDCNLTIIDKENNMGTIVKIILPILKK